MKNDVSASVRSLDEQEIEAKEDYYSSIDFLRDRLNVILLASWADIKAQSILTESILRRLEGYYRCEYKRKSVKGKGTIGLGVGDYFEDLIADTLRRYLKLVFEKEWASGTLQFFHGKRIKNKTPDIVIQVKGVPLIALEVKVNFGKKQLNEVKTNYDLFSQEGIEYFVVASGFTQDLLEEKTEEFWEIFMGPDEAKKLNWIYVVAEWFENQIEGIKIFETRQINSIEPLFEKIQSAISHALQK